MSTDFIKLAISLIGSRVKSMDLAMPNIIFYADNQGKVDRVMWIKHNLDFDIKRDKSIVPDMLQ